MTNRLETTANALDEVLTDMLTERGAREYQKKKAIEKLLATLCEGAADKAAIARRIAALDGDNFNDRQSILAAIMRGWTAKA